MPSDEQIKTSPKVKNPSNTAVPGVLSMAEGSFVAQLRTQNDPHCPSLAGWKSSSSCRQPKPAEGVRGRSGCSPPSKANTGTQCAAGPLPPASWMEVLLGKKMGRKCVSFAFPSTIPTYIFPKGLFLAVTSPGVHLCVCSPLQAIARKPCGVTPALGVGVMSRRDTSPWDMARSGLAWKKRDVASWHLVARRRGVLWTCWAASGLDTTSPSGVMLRNGDISASPSPAPICHRLWGHKGRDGELATLLILALVVLPASRSSSALTFHNELPQMRYV